MFDNVLHQSASDLLTEDIAKNKLPSSLLFSGPEASGKLTCALELARVLSCKGAVVGKWNCSCSSCQKHKALVSPQVLVVGPKNQTLEIEAAATTLLSQNANNTRHVEAARFLYLRAVRKLTVRFNPVLWEGEEKLQKFSPLLQAIDESLEQLEPSRPVPEGESLSKILSEIKKNCEKLETSFLYDALPVSQIRTISSWAHLSTSTGRKVVIIENADRMAESARNALLKILEEPPADCVFILTTARRGALMQTILSRVRTYTFFERAASQQQEVITRVFHYDAVISGRPLPNTLYDFLQTYLPVAPDVIRSYAHTYFKTLAEGHLPDIQKIVQGCANFDPRTIYALFIRGVIEAQTYLTATAAGTAASVAIVKELRRAANMVSIYNQNPAACLEELARTIMQINYLSGGILKEGAS